MYMYNIVYIYIDWFILPCITAAGYVFCWLWNWCTALDYVFCLAYFFWLYVVSVSRAIKFTGIYIGMICIELVEATIIGLTESDLYFVETWVSTQFFLKNWCIFPGVWFVGAALKHHELAQEGANQGRLEGKVCFVSKLLGGWFDGALSSSVAWCKMLCSSRFVENVWKSS